METTNFQIIEVSKKYENNKEKNKEDKNFQIERKKDEKDEMCLIYRLKRVPNNIENLKLIHIKINFRFLKAKIKLYR